MLKIPKKIADAKQHLIDRHTEYGKRVEDLFAGNKKPQPKMPLWWRILKKTGGL